MLKKNLNKIYIIFFLIIIVLYFIYGNLDNILLQFIALNQKSPDLELITELVEKYLNLKNVPILSENEKLISLYWKEKPMCPFSKLISHGLTKEEALLIIEFFKIESIQDLEKLKKWVK